jgi:hypothetical protein
VRNLLGVRGRKSLGDESPLPDTPENTYSSRALRKYLLTTALSVTENPNKQANLEPVNELLLRFRRAHW